jgi:structural maintenance of chromosome 4
MKPKAQNPNDVGLLEYLEDIIGSNKYVERIEESEKTLESKNDERIEKTNRMRACQAELRALEEDKEKAIEYLKKERNLMILLNMIYFVELGDGVAQVNK